METTQSSIILDLKKIRTSGVSRVDLSSIPSILQLDLMKSKATSKVDAPLFQSLQDVLTDAIRGIGNEPIGVALRHLLGLEKSTRAGSLDRVRRPRAAEAVGYSASYLARYKEEEYLVLLSQVILALDNDANNLRVQSELRDERLESILLKAEQSLKSAPIDLALVAMNRGLEPILQIASNPRFVRRNFSYKATLELLELGDRQLYSIEGAYHSIRSFHVDLAESKVMFCRTYTSLNAAFADRRCISAELCNISLENWWQFAREYLGGTIEIEDDAYVLELESFDEEVAVYNAVGPPIALNECRVVFRNTYLMPASARIFPIKLANHFCMGPLEAELRLIDGRVARLDANIYLAGIDRSEIDLYSRGQPTEKRWEPRASKQKVLGVRLPSTSLVWPGSGIDFVWELSTEEATLMPN